ncbi:MAG: hypothetical protein WD875_19475 [Pirellulales bacterium]
MVQVHLLRSDDYPDGGELIGALIGILVGYAVAAPLLNRLILVNDRMAKAAYRTKTRHARPIAVLLSAAFLAVHGYLYFARNPWRSADSLDGHAATVTALAASSDGKRLASLDENNSLRIWDMNNGEQIRAIEAPAYVRGAARVALSSSGELVAIGLAWDHPGESNVLVWNTNSGELLRQWPYDELSVHDLATRPN